MNKKLVFKVMTTAALLSAFALPASAAVTLTDIDGSYAKDAINQLVQQGIINGKGNGKFDPTGKIERQDFAIILAKALSLDMGSAPATPTFSDVPTSHYAYNAVEAAVKAGLIKGQGDGIFGNGENLSRQDMAVLFVRALGLDVEGKGADLEFRDARKISWYALDYVAAAVEIGLIKGNGDGTFNPTGSADRQAVAQVAAKFISKAEELKNQAQAHSEGEEKEPAEPQTPAPTTPPAASGSTGGSGGSGGGGGTTNPGTPPVNSELPAPSLAFTDARTIAITYSVTLDPSHVPTTEDIRVTGKDGDVPFEIGIDTISVQGKEVLVKLSNSQELDRELEVSYRPQAPARAIRSTTGKLSPVFSNKKVVYQTNDPKALLDSLIENAQNLLDSASENTGNTTGKYPEFAIGIFGNALFSAISVQQDTMATEDQYKIAINSLNHALIEFEASKIKPLKITQKTEVFLLNPETITTIVATDGQNTYSKQSLKNLIQIQRGEIDQDIQLVLDSQDASFDLITNGEIIGSIELASSDEQLFTLSKQAGQDEVVVAPKALATEQSKADLILTVTEAENVVQTVKIPVKFDATKPTVTSSTYENGTFTLTSDEPLYNFTGTSMPLPMTVEIRYSFTGDFANIPLNTILLNPSDFNIEHSNGNNTVVVTLTESGYSKLPPAILPTAAFQIRFINLGDFVGHVPDPVVIPVPALPIPIP